MFYLNPKFHTFKLTQLYSNTIIHETFKLLRSSHENILKRGMNKPRECNPRYRFDEDSRKGGVRQW